MDIVSAYFGMLAAILASLLSAFPGFGTVLRHFANTRFQAEILPIAETIKRRQRNEITQGQYLTELSNYGFNAERAEALYNVNFLEMPLGEAFLLYHRFKNVEDNPLNINEDWLTKIFERQGINPDNFNEIKEVYRAVPTLQDIMRFADRDVYNPESVKLLDLYKEIPPKYIQEAKARGLSTQDAGFYWAAHWDVPSILQAFEMYHRLNFDDTPSNLKFDEKALDVYYNIAEIVPGMRERLTAIAYRTLNRVDVRRMYALGVFGENDDTAFPRLVKAYKELGYSPENAELMADFTKKYQTVGDRDLTKTQLLNFYKQGIFGDRKEGEIILREELEQLGYTQIDIEWTILDVNLKLDNEELGKQLEITLDEYITNEIKTQEDLIQKLAGLGLNDTEINYTKRDFNRKKKSQTKRLNKSEADIFERLEMLNEGEYEEILKSHNYSERAIQLFQERFDKSDEAEKASPTKADIISWYSDGIIKPPQFINKMAEIGYIMDDILLYALAVGKPIGEELQ